MDSKTLDTLQSPAMARLRRPLSPWLLTAAGGLFAVLATFAVSGSVGHLIVWPTSGITIALSLLVPTSQRMKRLCIYCAGGAGVFAGGFLCGIPWWLAGLVSGLTALDLALGNFFLSPHVRNFASLKRRRNVIRLIIVSLLVPLATGALGAFWIALFFKPPQLMVVVRSALANALGITLFVPTVFWVMSGPRLLKRRLPGKLLPLLLSSALFFIVCAGTFWQTTGPYLFLIPPATMLLLLITGIEGATLTSLLIVVVGSVATTHNHGPFWLMKTSSPELRLLTLQVFFWVSSVTALAVGMSFDERLKAELDAVASRSLQRAILNHTRDAIILFPLYGRERYASAAIQAITGWTPAEFNRLDSLQTVHPEDRAGFQEALENLKRGMQNTSLRYRILHKDSSWSWVESSLSSYGKGHTGGYIGTVRDIASLVEAERSWIQGCVTLSEEQKRFAEAETAAKLQLKLRDEFLSNVSHELRSPLTSIYSFSSIIADGLAGDTTAEQNEYLEIVLKNVVQLQSMIEDLLTVTQSSEGKLNIEFQAICLTNTIADAMDTVRSFANRKHIALAVDRSEEHLPAVYADPTRVCQILIILLDNAIKFTPEGGKVKVAVSLQNAANVLIRVIDTGCGIPRDTWDLVFNKLYQVHGSDQQDTSKAGRSGLGLGLHIARTLVVRQSGHIWVTSEPNIGSVFHFTLPIYKERESESRIASQTMQTVTDTLVVPVGSTAT